MDINVALVAVFFVLCHHGVIQVDAYTVADAESLQSALFSSYSKALRPNATTDVGLEFGLMHITELDIVTQRLHCVGFLISYWLDDRLQWTPASYGNMTELFTLLSNIWSPPLVLSNAADEIKMLNDNSDLASVRAYLYYEGHAAWLAPASFVAQCTIKIQYYPFDSQECKIVVSSWLYLDIQLNLGSGASSVNLDIYEEHGEWEIRKTTTANISRILSGYNLPAVQFTIYLKRKYSYYLMNMLLPVIVLATMAPFVFILPPESGEKIGFALTILLSLSVVMTIVSDNIPPTSTHVCVLSVYLLLTFIICSLQTLVTVLTCRLHELHYKQYEMGPFLQSITGCLAKFTRYRRRLKRDEKCAANEFIDTNIKALDIVEKRGSRKKRRTAQKAWTVEQELDDNTDEIDDIVYTYEDLVCIFEKFNFVIFFIVTLLVTLTFMMILEIGGSEI